MIKIIQLSSLEKVFKDEKPKGQEFLKFSMLKNERLSFQIAVISDKDTTVSFKIESKIKYNAYIVKSIPSVLAAFDDHDDYYLRTEPGEYPDLLLPISKSFEVNANEWNSLWIELCPDKDIKQGVYNIKTELSDGDDTKKSNLQVEVIDAELPKQKLIYTNWFHSDCLMTYYHVDAFSDEYWRIVENFVRAAVKHGQNMILTPLFTPPLDTQIGGERPTVQLVKVFKSGETYTFNFDNLKKWVDICLKSGIEYFEMSHLFTQWGAKRTPKIIAEANGEGKQIFGWKTFAASKKYEFFLTQFAKALKMFIEKEGIKERCFFHVSDEPGIRDYRAYKLRSDFIRILFPGYRIIDALSDFEFYQKGVIKLPIPSNDHVEDFIGNVEHLWTYYCCGQGKEYVSNRFFSMPSQRNRVLGTQLYKFNVEGFLQWGYNFWFSQYSIRTIDPFNESDAGGSFPSGDAYVVYPGEDGDALISLRLKVFYDGIQDLRALRLLESFIGREKTIELIEEGLEKEITFKEYPHSAQWQLDLRDRVNRTISKEIAEQ